MYLRRLCVTTTRTAIHKTFQRYFFKPQKKKNPMFNYLLRPLTATLSYLWSGWGAIASLLLFCAVWEDRKSTRLNSSHVRSSYAVFCLKKKTGRRAGGPGGEAVSDERSESLASQMGAWVPPWERKRDEPDREFQQAAEQEAAPEATAAP